MTLDEHSYLLQRQSDRQRVCSYTIAQSHEHNERISFPLVIQSSPLKVLVLFQREAGEATAQAKASFAELCCLYEC